MIRLEVVQRGGLVLAARLWTGSAEVSLSSVSRLFD